MSHVLRLEEFPCNSIERSDGRPVIQYRGEILRLVNWSRDPNQADGCVSTSVQVVVLSNGHEKLGYVVDKIVDIVSVSVHLRDADDSSCAIVVGDRVTDLIDVPLLLTNSTSR
jgi:two-component system chemotaxis sensor kinase CheA